MYLYKVHVLELAIQVDNSEARANKEKFQFWLHIDLLTPLEMRGRLRKSQDDGGTL
jgi:hypothetical protein